MHPLQSLFLPLRRTLSLAAGLALLTGCAATVHQEGLEQRTAQGATDFRGAMDGTQSGAGELQIRVAGGPGGRR